MATTLDSVWANWPGFQQPERRQVCMQHLWGVTQPPFPPRYLTLVPLQRAAPEACFWLSLLRQWAAVRANPAIVAWPADETAGPMRLAYDELHSRYFEPLFWPDRADSGVLDVGRPTSARGGAAGRGRRGAAPQDLVAGRDPGGGQAVMASFEESWSLLHLSLLPSVVMASMSSSRPSSFVAWSPFVRS